MMMQLLAILIEEETSKPVNPLVIGMVTLFILAAGVILMIYTRNRIAKRNQAMGTARHRIEQIKERAQAGSDTSAAMADLLDTAQRLAAQLDNKAEQLEQLIHQADERLARERMIDPDSTEDSSTSPSANDVDRADIEALAADVCRLSDEGFSSIEIAQRLEETTGKVELILALRKSSSGLSG